MTNQAVIAEFIKNLREERGLTQKEVARELKTSQSAIARIERGEQNLSMEILARIGQVLGRKIINLSPALDFEIDGGHKLKGVVVTNFSKNGSMALLVASLLNRSTTTIEGIARIEEVNRMLEVFESIGLRFQWVTDQTLKIEPPKKFNLQKINKEATSKMRSALMLIGPLASLGHSFNLPHAGGCQMGERTIAAHRLALKKLGIVVETKSEHYKIYNKKKKPAEIVLYEASDTAAINTLLAAALIPGETIIRYAPPNYQVQETCFFLEKCGVKIEGTGTTTIRVWGVKEINKPITYQNSEDPIEAMLFITAAILTDSALTIKRAPIRFLESELNKLEVMGLKYKRSEVYRSKNQRTELVDLEIKPSKLVAPPDKLHSTPYPGINVDNLPFFVSIATQARGQTLIHDWMWENRAIYFTELNRLGAKVNLADPHRVFIQGPTKLKSNQVVCPPALRPATIILLSMLAAEGKSILRNVYSINRGYEELATRLNKLGAKIKPLYDLKQ